MHSQLVEVFAREKISILILKKKKKKIRPYKIFIKTLFYLFYNKFNYFIVLTKTDIFLAIYNLSELKHFPDNTTS